MRKILLLAVLGTSLLSASALSPLSYDVLNGETGTFDYHDNSYTGSGCTTCNLSPLTGGLGDLTDGVIATQNWFATPLLYVGWISQNPPITFHFGSSKLINSITIHVDDSNNNGGVSTPGSAVVEVGGSTLNFALTDGASGAPLSFTLPIGLTGSDLALTLNDGSDVWVMVSEVSFDGSSSPVPEPGAFGLIACGLGGLALVRRRRQS